MLRRVSPVRAGLACRCPACGVGPLFSGMLVPRPTCSVCGADLSVIDSGDGPAFFVMFAVLILLAPSAMLLELAFSPPSWVHLAVWPPAVLVLSAALLRPFKAYLFALQWHHDAREGQLVVDPERRDH